MNRVFAIRRIIPLSSLLLLCLTAHAQRFQQDQFAIGFWVAPPEITETRYAEIAGANFNLVIGSNGAATAEDVQRQVALCDQHGLKVLIAPQAETPAPWEGSKAVWGYAVRDEPNATDFPALRAQVDAIRMARPGKLAYINLFPTYASEKQLGTPTYEEHVRRFIDEVTPDVLSMDHYPRFAPNADGRNGYCENLAVMREQSLRANIPFWNFFNAMPYGPHTDPTEAQMRWQINASLAHGARGVLYFCYWTPRGEEFPKGGAILTAEGLRTRHYEEAKRLNLVLKHLGPTLMSLQSKSVVRIAPDTDTAEALDGTPLAAIRWDKVDPPNDYLLGVFQHADGRRGVLLMNYQFAYSAWPTVEFSGSVDAVREIDPASGSEIAVLDDSPDMEGIQLSLDAGGARLFLLP